MASVIFSNLPRDKEVSNCSSNSPHKKGTMKPFSSAIQTAKHLRLTRNKFLSCEAGVIQTPSLIIYLLGVCSISLAIGSIVLSGLIVSDLAGVFVCMFAPYMMYQKALLRNLGTLREQINFLRNQINHFQAQNEFLKGNVSRLSGSVDDLEKAEKELSKLSKGNDVDRLVKTVKKKQMIDEQMKKGTESAIIQQLITTVLRSDKDKDLLIGEMELNELMLRLDAHPGFIFNKMKFLSVLGDVSKPVSVTKVMSVIRNLKDPNLSAHDRVFVIDSNN